jgi:hypothetical protein
MTLTHTPKCKVGQPALLTRNTGPFDERVEVLHVEWRESQRSIGLGNDEGRTAWSSVPGEFVYKVRRQGGEIEEAVNERDLRPFDRGDQ